MFDRSSVHPSNFLLAVLYDPLPNVDLLAQLTELHLVATKSCEGRLVVRLYGTEPQCRNVISSLDRRRRAARLATPYLE